MKTLFDHQIFSQQKYGGISRYYSEIMYLLAFESQIKCSLLYTTNEHLKEKGLLPDFFTSKVLRFLIPSKRIKRFLYKRINKIYSIFYLLKGDFDVFHPTYYDTYFLRYLLDSKKLVVTVYDLTHEKFSSHIPSLKKDFSACDKHFILKRADMIIAISESTKKDIIQYYGIASEKIRVIYLATGPANHYLIAKEFESRVLNNKYLLFVGNRTGYKNFNLFVEAVSELLLQKDDLVLLCAGGSSFTLYEIKWLQERRLEKKVVHVNFNNDLELNFLYRNAVCFIFPSLYEGFGIPILEAFANQCPVVASNTSSLPEVGGDAAMYFDPNNQADILEKITMMIDDEALKEDMVKRGNARLLNFSWEKCAREHLDVYQSVI